MKASERLTRMLMRLVRLYPTQFRAEFGSEMIYVLIAALTDAAKRGRQVWLRTLLREMFGLLIGAAREHRQAYLARRASPSEAMNLTRILARAMATMSSGWWLLILLLNEDVRASMVAVPLGCIVALGLVGAAIEPWRQRTSGWMVFASGLLLVAIMLLSPYLRGMPLNIFMAIFVGLPNLAAGSLMLDAPMLYRRSSGAFLTAGLGWVALSLSWWCLYVVAAALTEIWLVPWDTWSEPVRPPVGTWQRTLNDFFESGIGASLSGILLIAAGALALLLHIYRGARLAFAPWLIAAANLLVLMLNLIAVPIVNWVYYPTTTEKIGYGYTWPGILMMVVSCGVLLTLARLRLFHTAHSSGHEVPT